MDVKLAMPAEPNFYRGRALEVLKWAKQANVPEVRAELRILAQRWKRLAQIVEHLRG